MIFSYKITLLKSNKIVTYTVTKTLDGVSTIKINTASL
jgi:hypothetical protein